jgi:NADPH:quinone reductase-like Zn-dependent oxidoreductase
LVPGGAQHRPVHLSGCGRVGQRLGGRCRARLYEVADEPAPRTGSGVGGGGEDAGVGHEKQRQVLGVAAVPEGLSLTVAGALGLAGTAAVDALDAVAPQPGDTVLISGATGGVGAIAVQYAAAAGARVVATARPGAEADFLRGLGAHEVIDHTADLVAQVRAISPDGVDAVLHLAGDGPTLAGLLAAKGRLASTLGLEHPAATSVLANPATGTLDRLAADVAAGRLTVPVARSYPLAEVPAAFGDFAAGTRGKLGITI